MTEATTAKPASETAEAAGKNTFTTITLNEPIIRGDTKIETVTVRKPGSGELRGLSLQDLIGTDITALLKLFPRITEPVLTDDECHKLDPADLTEMGGAVRGFFMTKAERMFLEQIMEEHQSTT